MKSNKVTRTPSVLPPIIAPPGEKLIFKEALERKIIPKVYASKAAKGK